MERSWNLKHSKATFYEKIFKRNKESFIALIKSLFIIRLFVRLNVVLWQLPKALMVHISQSYQESDNLLKDHHHFMVFPFRVSNTPFPPLHQFPPRITTHLPYFIYCWVIGPEILDVIYPFCYNDEPICLDTLRGSLLWWPKNINFFFFFVFYFIYFVLFVEKKKTRNLLHNIFYVFIFFI